MGVGLEHGGRKLSHSWHTLSILLETIRGISAATCEFDIAFHLGGLMSDPETLFISIYTFGIMDKF